MKPSRLLILLAAAAPLAAPAHAQGFFERLFGPPRPFPQQRAPVPPASIPERGPPAQMREPSGAEPGPVQRALPAPPAPPKPVVLKAPSEDSVVGRELKLNGVGGSLKVERVGGEYRISGTLPGTKVSNQAETCAVPVGSDGSAALTSEGKPEGVPRYRLQAPVCSLQIDVLDGSLLVRVPAETCPAVEADCHIEPRGLWGPEPGSLLAEAKAIERTRGAADRAVRENYKVLTQRANPTEVRPIVAEQAAFSAEREQVCHGYAREAAHGFCNTRYTEARALALAAKLGVATTASSQPIRRRRPQTSAGEASSSDIPVGAVR